MSLAVLTMAGCDEAGASGGGATEPPGDPGPFLHGEGVHRGSPAIIGWATGLGSGGYEPGVGAEAYTDPERALGPASGVSTDVLVLGDGGQVTLTFAAPIVNAPGYADFAVYENGIADPNAGTVFAELGWVAVASRENATDQEFARFPATTTRTEPVGGYDTGLEQIDPDQYSGFAGIHPAGTGTAFDLQELAGHDLVMDGVVDLSAIRYVRIIDVIGDGSQLDDSDPPQPIYDPYPTYNPDITGNTAGFDLDGVAVLRNP
ncbi:MAG: PEP-CTERM sorting domain-containing protein [Spirochaetaceae bacterium]|nr:MAG: PEP-CTERM sorting domain-containing protein [Spirochaetaceae bacterium]